MDKDRVKDKFFDELLAYAGEVELERMISEFPAAQELDEFYNVTPEFEQKMHKLLKKQEQKIWGKLYRQRFIKIAAGIVLLLGIFFTVPVNPVEAWRAELFCSITELRDDLLSVGFAQRDPFIPFDYSQISADWPDVYLPTYLPPGFYLAAAENSDNEDYMLIFGNHSTNEEITYQQLLITDNLSITFDSKNAQRSKKSINDLEINILQKQPATSQPPPTITTLYWRDDKNFYILISSVHKKELLKIASGLELQT